MPNNNLPETELLYVQNPNLQQLDTRLLQVGTDQKGQYLILAQTIFYPQGGGQLADQGMAIVDGKSYHIYDVRKIDQQVRHYINPVLAENAGSIAVTLQLDTARRLVNSRLHSAGHLLAALVEKYHPSFKAIKGHHFPGEAFVEFNGQLDANATATLQTYLAENLAKQIATDANIEILNLNYEQAKALLPNLPIFFAQFPEIIVWQTSGLEPIPCGGTHVPSLGALNTIVINKVTCKETTFKVFYAS